MRYVFLIVAMVSNVLHVGQMPDAQDDIAYWSKQAPQVEIIPLGTGRQFRFKGLAIDTKKQIAYLGSWDQKQIVAVNLTDKTNKIIQTPYSGRLNGMGTILRNNLLYTVMNEVDDSPGANPLSVLVVIDTETNLMLRSYEARSRNGRHHFNHVVVDDEGIAYISNTLKSGIYTVNTNIPGDTIKKLVEHPTLSWVHGLDLSPDNSKLFATSYQGGIRIFNLQDKTLSAFTDMSTAGDDGLKYHEGHLYGLGKNRLKQYTLNDAEDAVIKTKVLMDDHHFFNDPRCLQIQGDWIYCLANNEFDLATFGKDNPKLKKQPFTDTYIVKYRLSPSIK